MNKKQINAIASIFKAVGKEHLALPLLFNHNSKDMGDHVYNACESLLKSIKASANEGDAPTIRQLKETFAQINDPDLKERLETLFDELFSESENKTINNIVHAFRAQKTKGLSIPSNASGKRSVPFNWQRPPWLSKQRKNHNQHHFNGGK